MDGSISSQHHTILNEAEIYRSTQHVASYPGSGEKFFFPLPFYPGSGRKNLSSPYPEEPATYLFTKVIDGLRRKASSSQCSECEESRVIPVPDRV